MRIKKFIANSMQEGKVKVFKELGDDAVILSTRTVKSPSSNGEELIEIIAALDSNTTTKKEFNAPVKSASSSSLEAVSRMDSSASEFINATSQIYSEIFKLKEILFDISDSVKFKYTGILGEKHGTLFRNLRKLNFSEEFALNIIGKLTSLNQNMNYREISEKAKAMILENIKFSNPISKKRSRQIFSFIGPTGSGKTTTLVKLAIITKLILNGNVLLISTDNQKIGGSEQLQMYGSISSIPFRSVYTSEELNKVLTQDSDKDYVFIDTVGKSHLNYEHISDLSEMFNSIEIDQCFLVLNSNLSKSSYQQITESYKKIGFSSVIISKVDESIGLGEFTEALATSNFPISYITNGQQVPEDIEPASRESLSKFAFKDYI